MSVATVVSKSNPTNFELAIPVVPSETTLAATNELKLNIYGTIIPSMTLEDAEASWQAGKIKFQSGKLQFDPWTINFMVDSELKNWKVLANWLFYINNNKDVMGQAPDDAVIDATLRIIDNFNASILTVTFKNLWIQSLGEVSMSTREGESTLESNATFLYDRYEINY